MALPKTAVEVLTERDVAAALGALGPHGPQPQAIEKGYLTLHGTLRKAYSSAFRELAKRDKKHYRPTFTPEALNGSATLTRIPVLLGKVAALERLCADLAADLHRVPTIADALAGRVQANVVPLLSLVRSAKQAEAFLSDVAAESTPPVRAGLRDFASAAATAKGGSKASPRSGWPPPGMAQSAVMGLQVAVGKLLAAPFALQCAFAALSARELYEIDGNAGARAAAVKLGCSLADATGGDAVEDDLLRLRTQVGSLDSYASRLWRAFGIDLWNPKEPEVTPLAQLAARLVDAELRDAPSAGGSRESVRWLQRGADRLSGWSEPETKTSFAVARHLPTLTTGGRVRFAPTWPQITAQDPYVVSSNQHIMFASPGAQLGLFVACSLYTSARGYLVAPGRRTDLPKPVINAGCLQFGGAHPPHQTHRSGAEVDVDLAELRNLNRFHDELPAKLPAASGAGMGIDPLNPDAEFVFDAPQFAAHTAWNQQLQLALQRPEIDLSTRLFQQFKERPFDHYATPDPRPRDPESDPGVVQGIDSATEVAQARALCLSIFLSGASRVVFADPWVFIDAFLRLEEARPSSWSYAWPAHRAVFLDLYAHHNHWHAEWKHDLQGAKGRREAGPDISSWVPTWKALGIDLDGLTGLLDSIAGWAAPAIAEEATALAKDLAGRWKTTPDGLPHIFPLVFDGATPGERALRRDTSHNGS